MFIHWPTVVLPYFFSITCLNVCSSLSPHPPDIVVVGGGAAGLTAAKFGARFGKAVLLVERGRLGGDCTHYGCVPSKSLIAAAKIAHVSRSGESYGVTITGSVNVDWQAVKARLQRIVQRIYETDDSPEALEKLNIKVVNATASFINEDNLQLQYSDHNETIRAKYGFVIATGARPSIPDIKGLADVPYCSYENIFNLPALPEKLLVVGGGPIGCELAQAFRRLGSEVILVAPRLLPGMDPEAGAVLESVFTSEGMKVVKGLVVSARKSYDSGGERSGCIVSTDSGDELFGDVLLIATGRAAVVDSLALDNANVEYSSGDGIHTNFKLQTTARSIYAAGDCTGGPQFTHLAGFQGAIAARNLLLPLSDPGILDVPVSSCVFTSPEIAATGYSETEARNRFGDKKTAVVTRPLSEIDRSLCEEDNPKGFIKIIYHRGDFRILGALIAAPNAGEVIAEVSVAMAGKVKLPELASIVHAYPTLSIAVQQMAADIYYEKLESSMPLYNILKRIGL